MGNCGGVLVGGKCQAQEQWPDTIEPLLTHLMQVRSKFVDSTKKRIMPHTSLPNFVAFVLESAQPLA